MQTSEPAVRAQPASVLGTLFVLVVLAAASLWLTQDSIETYVEQTYHQPSPLAPLSTVPAWRVGAQAWTRLNEGYGQLRDRIAGQAAQVTEAFNQRMVLTESYHERQRQQAAAAEALRQQRLAEAAQLEAQQLKERYLALAAQDHVLMAGDSLMQGVAPHLQRELAQRFGISSQNLSRQSTGLSYPGSFDWPATIEAAVQDDPTLRLVVVMLGPNDPWDMPDPARHGGPYLRFQSEAWEQRYRERVARIINFNTAHGVSTLWVGAPGMKAARLDGQMQWLMTVIQSEVEKQGAVFLPSRAELPGAGAEGGYRDSVDVDGQLVKMRSGDGIHFSVAGQRYLAGRILETLRPPSR